MRLFAAVFIPKHLSEKIYEYSEQIAADFGTKPVHSENMHITLKFFGDKKTENCLEILENSVRNIKAFEADIKNTGFFSYGKFAGVLWAGVYGESNTLTKIALNIDSSQNKYMPHITLARFKSDTVENEVLERYLSENGMKEISFGRFKAEKLSLVESLSGACSAQYKVLKDFCLGK